MKFDVSNNACNLKFLKTRLSALIMQQWSYTRFSVEPIKVLEVLINQGVVTLNSVF